MEKKTYQEFLKTLLVEDSQPFIEIVNKVNNTFKEVVEKQFNLKLNPKYKGVLVPVVKTISLYYEDYDQSKASVFHPKKGEFKATLYQFKTDEKELLSEGFISNIFKSKEKYNEPIDVETQFHQPGQISRILSTTLNQSNFNTTISSLRKKNDVKVFYLGKSGWEQFSPTASIPQLNPITIKNFLFAGKEIQFIKG